MYISAVLTPNEIVFAELCVTVKENDAKGSGVTTAKVDLADLSQLWVKESSTSGTTSGTYFKSCRSDGLYLGVPHVTQVQTIHCWLDGIVSSSEFICCRRRRKNRLNWSKVLEIAVCCAASLSIDLTACRY